jgi:predicted metallopeptidase
MSDSRLGGRAGSSGFDFTLYMRRICEDMTDRVPELRHIDLSRILIGFAQVRKSTHYGIYASLTPMRFEGGRSETTRRGRRWTAQRFRTRSGVDVLYLLHFYLPRFFDLSFDEKLTTIIHELWHVSPEFNGDVRRYDGRCYAHSRSGDHDRVSKQMADAYLATEPPDVLYEFLRYDFSGLEARYGRVFGQKLPTPKLIPVA